MSLNVSKGGKGVPGANKGNSLPTTPAVVTDVESTDLGNMGDHNMSPCPHNPKLWGDAGARHVPPLREDRSALPLGARANHCTTFCTRCCVAAGISKA